MAARAAQSSRGSPARSRRRVPWCSRGLTPPRLWLSECTQPRPFWKAIAPCIDALIMCRRAPRSWPSRVARSMCTQPRARPSSAMPSAGGLNGAAMKVSMQCARVSGQRAGMGGRDRHALGEVDAGAAAHRDQPVAARLPVDLDRGAHAGAGRDLDLDEVEDERHPRTPGSPRTGRSTGLPARHPRIRRARAPAGAGPARSGRPPPCR